MTVYVKDEVICQVPDADTYILGIKLKKNVKISVGRLGRINFRKGYYLYIGRAKKRLYSRLRRHLSRDKKIFWHIDYLLTSRFACLKHLWVGSNKRECEVVDLINNSLSSKIIKDFGSSDCRCAGHLIFINKYLPLKRLLKTQGFKQVRL